MIFFAQAFKWSVTALSTGRAIESDGTAWQKLGVMAGLWFAGQFQRLVPIHLAIFDVLEWELGASRVKYGENIRFTLFSSKSR